jgi:16S rRNA (cytosine1402-N4)-methyltransferase
MSNFHTPVLLQEVIEGLKVKPDGKYIDGTLGGGSHTEAILAQGGRVLGLDVDTNALAHCAEKFRLKKVTEDKSDPFFALYAEGPNLTLVKTNFRQLMDAAERFGFLPADGVLLDLGVSSYQLDTPSYGLSFRLNEALDMRMDRSLAVTAETIVNQFPEKDLERIFREYGEEIHAKRIASAIVRARQHEPVNSTQMLASIVEKVVPRTGKIHPATRIFQALRIVVNSELINLEAGLTAISKVLKKDGILAVISFHSLEDRIVKHELARNGALKEITSTPITPSEEEIERNIRSRSAKLRLAIKI